VHLHPYTSTQTCSARDGIGSLPLVLPEENLDVTPRAFSGVGVGPGVGINEDDAVVDGSMRVTQRTEIVVRTPAITDERSAAFDPGTYDGRVSAVLSCTGIRNVLSDSRSTPLNTH